MTLFSAPNYCGEFDNAGGMMSVDETLMCSFQVCLTLNLINHNAENIQKSLHILHRALSAPIHNSL